MKTVLHIGSAYKKGGGGAFVLRETFRLLENHTINDLIAIDCGNSESKKEIKSWQQYRGLKKVINALFSTEQYNEIKKWTKDKKFDVIHVQNYLSGLSPSLLKFLKEQKKQGVRLIFTAHEYSGICANSCLYNYGKNAVCERCIGSNFKLRCAFLNCDRRGHLYSLLKGIRALIYYNRERIKDLFDNVICVSEFQKQKYLQDGYAPEKLTFIQNPISDVFFVSRIPEKKKQILYYGRISPEKNIELLIDAFAEMIKEPDLTEYKLLLIGSGDSVYQNRLQRRIRDLKLEKTVTFCDMMPQQEVVKKVGESMLCIQPAKWYETFGLTVVESLAAGTPCAVSDIGAVGETARQYGGYLFESGSQTSLTTVMKQILRQWAVVFPEFLDRREILLDKLKNNQETYKKSLLQLYEVEKHS